MGTSQEELGAFTKEMTLKGYNIQTTLNVADVANACNLIVTATPSKKILLTADVIKPGTHITAMGSDTPDKIELDPAILQKADVIVADSIEQSLSRGRYSRPDKPAPLMKRGLLSWVMLLPANHLGERLIIRSAWQT